MLGCKERGQLELFITGPLGQLIPEDHALMWVDRFLDLSGCATRSATLLR